MAKRVTTTHKIEFACHPPCRATMTANDAQSKLWLQFAGTDDELSTKCPHCGRDMQPIRASVRKASDG